MASTLVANPWVHVEMAANLVNPKLQCNSRKRRKLRTSSLRAASRPDWVARSSEQHLRTSSLTGCSVIQSSLANG